LDKAPRAVSLQGPTTTARPINAIRSALGSQARRPSPANLRPGRFSPSLGDCPGAPNNRWLWASAALPACGQACARSRPGGAGSAGGWCRRSWLTYLIWNARMRPQPPLPAGASVRFVRILSGRVAGGVISPTSRAEHPLVAQDPVRRLVHLSQKSVSLKPMAPRAPQPLNLMRATGDPRQWGL